MPNMTPEETYVRLCGAIAAQRQRRAESAHRAHQLLEERRRSAALRRLADREASISRVRDLDSPADPERVV
jgi:hypothetical protein